MCGIIVVGVPFRFPMNQTALTVKGPIKREGKSFMIDTSESGIPKKMEMFENPEIPDIQLNSYDKHESV